MISGWEIVMTKSFSATVKDLWQLGQRNLSPAAT
jgi:hypothetical protein